MLGLVTAGKPGWTIPTSVEIIRWIAEYFAYHHAEEKGLEAWVETTLSSNRKFVRLDDNDARHDDSWSLHATDFARIITGVDKMLDNIKQKPEDEASLSFGHEKPSRNLSLLQEHLLQTLQKHVHAAKDTQAHLDLPAS